MDTLEPSADLPDFGLPEDLPQSSQAIKPDKGSDVSRETKTRIRQTISYRNAKALPAILAEIQALRSLRLVAPQQLQTIAFLNPRLASGKSSTVANIAVTLAEYGLRVLIIDLTSTTSKLLGAHPTAGTIADVLHRRANFSQIIYSLTQYSGELSIVPADSSIAEAELNLLYQPGKETRLRDALQGAGEYDYILIDCPSNFGVLTLNAVLAANNVAAPVDAKNAKIDLSHLDTLLKFTEENFGTSADVRMAFYCERVALDGDAYLDASEVNGRWNVLESKITYSRDIEEFGREATVAVSAIPESEAMLAYLKVARELNKLF